MIETGEPTVASVPIRMDYLWSRPFTQMERKHHAQRGVTLINRFSSYYESLPKKGPVADIPDELIGQLTKAAKEVLASKQLDDLSLLFVWRRTTEATRQFAQPEFEMLFQSEIHSISFQPRSLIGNVIHWSAYQHYKPNLAIVGYLSVVYTSAGDPLCRMKTLSLEVGRAGCRLWLVNYITDGSRGLPKAFPAMTFSSQNEKLPNDDVIMYWKIKNPGSLLSAHLANEELWQWTRLYATTKVDVDLRVNPQLSLNLEKSDRLKKLFQRLGVSPRLLLSSHARNLPELYELIPEKTGRFRPRKGIVTHSYNIGIKYDPRGESICLKYIPKTKRFYIKHRFDLSDPHHERVFGPYDGNPYELLPDLEQSLVKPLSDGAQCLGHRSSIQVNANGPDRSVRWVLNYHPKNKPSCVALNENGRPIPFSSRIHLARQTSTRTRLATKVESLSSNAPKHTG